MSKGVCKDQLKYYVATFEFCHGLNLKEVCGFERVEGMSEAIFFALFQIFHYFPRKTVEILLYTYANEVYIVKIN